MIKPAEAGFTLIELIVALSVSVFVMIGAIEMATMMVRFQYEGIRKGEVTGLTLYSLDQMNKELENATHLELPSSGSPTGNVISGCTNYSVDQGGIIDATTSVTAFYYCVNTSHSLLRYSGATCPYPPPGSCGSGAYSTVVYQNFYLGDGQTYFFSRSNTASGVSLNYIVGNATASTNVPVPVYFKFSTQIGMNKPYTSVND